MSLDSHDKLCGFQKAMFPLCTILQLDGFREYKKVTPSSLYVFLISCELNPDNNYYHLYVEKIGVYTFTFKGIYKTLSKDDGYLYLDYIHPKCYQKSSHVEKLLPTPKRDKKDEEDEEDKFMPVAIKFKISLNGGSYKGFHIENAILEGHPWIDLKIECDE